ncbi:MAG: hypothetical protein K6F26_09340 [Lachnospiraceae bacterium]|nr:hypothetical protein [Lachnospiraceae bacterium]
MGVRYYTELKSSRTGQMPYHFICNYCGRRNDMSCLVAGVFEKTIGGYISKDSVTQSILGSTMEVGAQQQLVKCVDLIRKQTDNYAEWLKTGKKKKFDGTNYEDYTPKNLCNLYRYVHCDHCGRRQAWGMNPAEGSFGRKNAFLFCFSLFIAIILFMISFFREPMPFKEDIVAQISIIFAVIIPIIFVIAAVIRFFRNKKAISQEPNDPDKLPVPDLSGREVLQESLAPIDMKNKWVCKKCGMRNKNSNRTCAGCGAEK